MKVENPLTLGSAGPINDGGRKYNYIYWISAIVLAACFMFFGSISGIIFGFFLGLCVGWLVKNKVLDIICPKLRFVEFNIVNKINYDDLITRLIPCLTPLGMTIEKSADKGGCPVILYQNMIYDISYSNSKNTFTIWWRKNIARALFSIDSIKTYRKIVVAMGIIGYHVQQVTNVNNNMGNVLQENSSSINSNVKMVNKFCMNCGTQLEGNSRFCPNCGKQI